MRNGEATAEHRLQLFVGLVRESCDLAAANAIGDITEGDGSVGDGADDFIFRPKVFECSRHIFIRVEIEGRAAPAGHVDCVVCGRVDLAQFQRSFELGDSFFVGEEALAHEVFGLHRFLEIGVAVSVINNTASVRAGKVDFDAALSEVPVRMRNFRQPERSFGAADDK